MSNESPFKFTIGKGRWAEEIRYHTAELDKNYWADFTPLSDTEIDELQRAVNRKLPKEFRLFLKEFGHGRFTDRFGGGIWDPEDIEIACDGHLCMVLGCSGWASDEDRIEFYKTRGKFNPAPDKFTALAMELKPADVNLLDLLQFGTDGSCGYHQAYVGDKPGPIGYCRLYPGMVEDCEPTFSGGLRTILTHHWKQLYPEEENKVYDSRPWWEQLGLTIEYEAGPDDESGI